ncbi:acetyl-CoA acetyltransferase [Simiduia litorea]|uniref:acetyl-CoA acetyltransferase n=1 Tax=Simiduia litorea TaxID=1435348 RepID=UPI0036F2212D
MATEPIYILGGYQSDFAQNLARTGGDIGQLFIDTVRAGLQATALDAADVDVGHVGNFVSASFTGQAHLGGFFGHVDPAMAYMPASSHEAACASGSMAILAAMADLEAGRYGVACVVGLEVMRNVSANVAANNLAAAAWVGQEWSQAEYLWPAAFDDVLSLYQETYGVDYRHLAAISEQNFSNAKRNPKAQTRGWKFGEQSFAQNDEANPVVCGNLRRQDCGQITDGAAVVFLASKTSAQRYAQQRGITLESLPMIKGWGHVNAPLLFKEKQRLNHNQPYLFPHVDALFRQTLKRAQLEDIHGVDGIELHDCFSITQYMILDHAGLNKPGEIWKTLEAGTTSPTGSLPVNMSGGLIGLGHPVGATGVRMLLDAYKQVAGRAGEYQIENARNMMTVNLGGSTTTCVSFIVG